MLPTDAASDAASDRALRDGRLGELPDDLVPISTAASVRAEGKAPGHPAGVGTDGRREVGRAWRRVNRENELSEPRHYSSPTAAICD